MRDFERNLIRNIDREQELVPRDAYEHALKVLEESEIPLSRFSDLYSAESIARDQELVRQREQHFAHKDAPDEAKYRRLGIVFEAIFLQHAELSNWLGESTQTSRTTRFDDVINGVDVIAEIPENEYSASYLATAIDVTFGKNTRKKITNIKERLDRGKLTQIKYFISNALHFRGELERVPRVVVAVAPETVQELMNLWQQGANKELSEHFVQFQILDEIIAQLDVFARYAELNGFPDIARTYKRVHALCEKIKAERLATTKDSGIRDSLFESLKSDLDQMFA